VSQDWQDANNEYLAAALSWLRLTLRRHAQPADDTGPRSAVPAVVGKTAAGAVQRRAITEDQVAAALEDWDSATACEPAPALVELSRRLGLTPFEQKILLLCVALELDPSAGDLCALAQRDERKPWPTFALALELFADRSWDALVPQGPLRHWRLVEITQLPGQPLTGSALRADERIVSYVKGLNYLDDRLEPLLAAVPVPETDLPASHQAAVAEVMRGWARSSALSPAPVVQLLGPDHASKLAVAADAAGRLGRRLYRLATGLLPPPSAELEIIARLWSREGLLLPLALYIDADFTEAAEPETAAPGRAAVRFLTVSSGVFLLGTAEACPELRPAAPVVDIARPTAAEQRATWLAVLGPGAEPSVDRLTGQFDFDVATIRAIARPEAAPAAGSAPAGGDTPAAGDTPAPESQLRRLWDACAASCRPQMDALAQRIESSARWEDLVLPEPELRLLRQVGDQVRHRAAVYHDGGFADRFSRGLGITALFAGPSGTGKTLAAEILANELRLSLYRIDLSAVVSKYIGETEKNLRRLFEAAEQGAAVLFFDEADALFGKRSEVHDSHDRYANIEVNYLLQRMESYRGVAILATNMRSALDPAFLRRLRFVLTFPFPAAAERRAIWSRVFPSRTQTAGLDLDRLAGLTATGGMISNIALNAAFLAARAAEPVSMPLVLEAARAEYRKLELPVAEGDFAWHQQEVATPA
jgi:hypothetical protein